MLRPCWLPGSHGQRPLELGAMRWTPKGGPGYKGLQHRRAPPPCETRGGDAPPARRVSPGGPGPERPAPRRGHPKALSTTPKRGRGQGAAIAGDRPRFQVRLQGQHRPPSPTPRAPSPPAQEGGSSPPPPSTLSTELLSLPGSCQGSGTQEAENSHFLQKTLLLAPIPAHGEDSEGH